MARMVLSYSNRIMFHGYLVYYVLSFKTRPTEASNAFPACLQDLQCLENSACFCRLLVPGKKGNKISGSSLRTCSCILSTHHHTNTFLNNINAFFHVFFEKFPHILRERTETPCSRAPRIVWSEHCFSNWEKWVWSLFSARRCPNPLRFVQQLACPKGMTIAVPPPILSHLYSVIGKKNNLQTPGRKKFLLSVLGAMPGPGEEHIWILHLLYS